MGSQPGRICRIIKDLKSKACIFNKISKLGIQQLFVRTRFDCIPLFLKPLLPLPSMPASGRIEPRRGGGMDAATGKRPGMADFAGSGQWPARAGEKAATGRPFLWFVSFGRAKEMNNKKRIKT